MPVRIGELLLKEKRITPAQLQEALNYQKTSGGKLGYNLVKLGFVKDEEITALLSKQYASSRSRPTSIAQISDATPAQWWMSSLNREPISFTAACSNTCAIPRWTHGTSSIRWAPRFRRFG